MKVAIMTFWAWPENYGSQLQCYALQEALRRRGHIPFLVRYAPRGHRPLMRRIRDTIKQIGKHILAWLGHHEARRSLTTLACRQRAAHEQRFEVFRERNLKQTEKVYRSFGELIADCPPADMYVVGSDQVWNNIGSDDDAKAWFLDFAPLGKPRVAFAVSLSSLTDRQAAFVAPLLTSFRAVSLREADGARICQELGRKDACSLCDPTLLLNRRDYELLVEKEPTSVPEEPFMLVYVLNVRTREDIFWSAIEAYANTHGLKIVLIPIQGAGAALSGTVPFEYPSIPRFIALIRAATCVVTNSYHGMLFAIQMERPFAVLLQHGVFRGTNARFGSVLEPLGLSGHCCQAAENLEAVLGHRPDWKSVRERRQEVVAEADCFLEANGL